MPIVVGGNRCADGSANSTAHYCTVPATDFIANCRTGRSANTAANRRMHR
jgi:hypothetical protein